MKIPTAEQITIAALWLRCNEGEGEEAAACNAVADWIEHESQDRFLKEEARKAGIPIARFRAALKRRLTDRLRQECAGILATD